MIRPGDFLLLHNSDRMSYLVQVPVRGLFSTHRGNIDYADVLAHEFGDTVQTHMGIRFHLLRPTLADLALRVKRTTTVTYPKDMGYALLQAMVFPGARVIECGTGSGALTSVLATFVQPGGRVYSYERRPEFSTNAQANVRQRGLDQYCEFFVLDPEQNGFRQESVDAVVLDVPEPWLLVVPAWEVLRSGNVLVVVVPTVEQVRRVTAAMEATGFARIQVREILERSWLVRATGMRPADRMVAHTVYIVTGHKVNRTYGIDSGISQPDDGGQIVPEDSC